MKIKKIKKHFLFLFIIAVTLTLSIECKCDAQSTSTPTCPVPDGHGCWTDADCCGGICGNVISGVQQGQCTSNWSLCGNGVCDPATGEDTYNCPADCLAAICGNGIIDPGEFCDPPGDAPICGGGSGSGVCTFECKCEATPQSTPTPTPTPTLCPGSESCPSCEPYSSPPTPTPTPTITPTPYPSPTPTTTLKAKTKSSTLRASIGVLPSADVCSAVPPAGSVVPLPPGCIVYRDGRGGTGQSMWLHCWHTNSRGCIAATLASCGIGSECDIPDRRIVQIGSECATRGTSDRRLACIIDSIHAELAEQSPTSVCKHYARCFKLIYERMGYSQTFASGQLGWFGQSGHSWNEVSTYDAAGVRNGTFYIDGLNNILYWCP